MAKRVSKRPNWLMAAHIVDIYSVSPCACEDFADYKYSEYHERNGFWLFDSPERIRSIAKEQSIQLDGTVLFYYEVYELEFDHEKWQAFGSEPSFPTNVRVPTNKHLEGFDVATFNPYGRGIEHSPLSCNSMADKLATNSHCLFASLEEAQENLNNKSFSDCEPGPYRIFSVNSVGWS